MIYQKSKSKSKKSTKKAVKKKNKLIKNNLKKRARNKLPRKKKSRIKKKSKKFFRVKNPKRPNQKTRAVVSGLLRLSDKIKSLIRFNFNLDQSLQNFFTGITKKVSGIKKVISEEREKHKQQK